MDLTQWRVVLNSLDGKQGSAQNIPAPRFEEVRHAGVCSEVCFFAYSTSFLLKITMLNI